MSMIEGLEGRQLLAATLVRVKSIVADNRGEVQIQLSERAVGVRGSAVQIYTAGPDGKLFTNDDVKQSIRFTYSENRKLIKLTANLAKDTAYRVKLDGKTRIKAENGGALLDGDYSKNGSSGDGKAGGNYEAQFGRDRTVTPTVLMRTSLGDITIHLRGDVAPRNASNFLSYANTRRYDNVIFTRGVAGFVDQGGALQITGDGQQASDLVATDQDAALQDEPRVLSNKRGTISFAKSGPNSVTNQFFFNIGDNVAGTPQSLDDAANNGTYFTPFAELVGSASLAVADAIAAKGIANLTSQVPAGESAQAKASVDKVPVNDVSLAQASLVPTRDLQIIYRTAVQMITSSKTGAA